MVTKPRILAREVKNGSDNLPADMHPVLRRVYLARHVSDVIQTENTLKHLTPFDQLKGIAQAVTMLAEAIEQQQRILIVGDYDADGATSCALAVRALRAMG